MATAVQRYQSKDGRLFESEKEADEHDLNCQYVDKLSELAATGHGDMGTINKAGAMKLITGWVSRKRRDLRELLIWYDVEQQQIDEKYKEKEAAE